MYPKNGLFWLKYACSHNCHMPFLPIKHSSFSMSHIFLSFLSRQCKLWKWFRTWDRNLRSFSPLMPSKIAYNGGFFFSNWSTPALLTSSGFRLCFQVSKVLFFLNHYHLSYLQQTCTCRALNKMEVLSKWGYLTCLFQSVSFHGHAAEVEKKKMNHLLLNILTRS